MCDLDQAAPRFHRPPLVLGSTVPMELPQRSREPSLGVRYQHGGIPVIGLTGGVASGKSAVAGILAELGSMIIDADSVGHELLADPVVRDRVIAHFGSGVVRRDSGAPGGPSAIDRQALGAIVFADPEERRALEAILHPLMRARFVAAIRRGMEVGCGGPSAIVLDAAILLEAGWDDLCDHVVFVDAPREDRVARSLRQRGWTREMFDARESAQWPCELKRRRATLAITNSADLESLRREVERLLGRLPRHSLGLVTATSRPGGELAATS